MPRKTSLSMKRPLNSVELKRAKVELAILSKEVDNTRRKLQHKTERLKTL